MCIVGHVISLSWRLVDTFIDELDLRPAAIDEQFDARDEAGVV